MSFPLGRPILLLIVVAIASAFAVGFHSSPPPADLTLLVFADSHAQMYRGSSTSGVPSRDSLLGRFDEHTGKSVQVSFIASQALDIRLISMFMAGESSELTPDLAEIEIGSIGKFFRGPVDDVGFLPLNKYLEKSGWMNRIVTTRFAPWSKDGLIFGIPHDLHPCTVTYREDLFDEAGIDLESAATWPEFQSRCLEFQRYWQAHGIQRSAIGLSSSGTDAIMILLQQERVDLVGADLSVHLEDEKLLQTLMWYAQAVAGPKRIAGDFNPAPGQSVRDLARGDICAMVTPDWELSDLRTYGNDMTGKLHMMPLPRFSMTDSPTASWGGTMIGITKHCKNPDLAWKVIEALYLSPDALHVRQQITGILPPIPEYWVDPMYQQNDPLFGGQKIDQLFLSLARNLPSRTVTAYTAAAQTVLSVILNRAVSHVRNDEGATLEPACRQWLKEAAESLRADIAFDRLAG